ncbi:MAG TPA: metal-sulfur cluster assembly factor [bacterium]|nr:metal-sulfur cluster assembly factor [bacterium]
MITPEQVREVLRCINDPELGVNIVDLGLVYDIEVRDGSVRVALTMTTPACPLHAYFTDEIDAAVRVWVPGVRAVHVDVVWEPPWQPVMMSDQAKTLLGWMEKR